MANVQVILAGPLRTSSHDTFDYPLVLQFGESRSYAEAMWVIPSYPRHIPAARLSEIRVDGGESLSVLIDGPDGFRAGPYVVTWVRSYYPRGKHCALLRPHEETKQFVGVTLTTIEDTLFIDAFPPARTEPTPTGS